MPQSVPNQAFHSYLPILKDYRFHGSLEIAMRKKHRSMCGVATSPEAKAQGIANDAEISKID